MFGTYRTLLTIAVLLDHYAGLGISSAPGVFGFLCLSGFLMTMLMDGPYKGRSGAFLFNRFLRIYPPYWFAFGLTIALFPVPAGLHLAGNLALFPYTDFLIPITWWVANEFVFYFLIGFGISRTLWRTVVWAGGSTVIVVAALLIVPASLTSFYFSLWCASVPFSFGALAYHLRDKIILPTFPVLPFAVVGVIASMLIGGIAHFSFGRDDLLLAAIYASLVPHAAIILVLFRMRSSSTDELIGRFSYPMYLLQMLGFMIVINKFNMERVSSLALAGAALLVTLALSGVLIALVDVPLQIIRTRVKSGVPFIPFRRSQSTTS
jgi:peptidoglycan/LPS O-acetylase OafA/YrhL